MSHAALICHLLGPLQKESRNINVRQKLRTNRCEARRESGAIWHVAKEGGQKNGALQSGSLTC